MSAALGRIVILRRSGVAGGGIDIDSSGLTFGRRAARELPAGACPAHFEVLIRRRSALRRDPLRCDIVLKLQDVSKLHASIEKDSETNQVRIATLAAHSADTRRDTTQPSSPIRCGSTT